MGEEAAWRQAEIGPRTQGSSATPDSGRREEGRPRTCGGARPCRPPGSRLGENSLLPREPQEAATGRDQRQTTAWGGQPAPKEAGRPEDQPPRPQDTDRRGQEQTGPPATGQGSRLREATDRGGERGHHATSSKATVTAQPEPQQREGERFSKVKHLPSLEEFLPPRPWVPAHR